MSRLPLDPVTWVGAVSLLAARRSGVAKRGVMPGAAVFSRESVLARAVIVLALIAVEGCSANTEAPKQAALVVEQVSQPLTNGSTCVARTDCDSGYCDNTGHCSPCTADGNCVEGTLGASGGQYCSNSGVCTARKADGQSCSASSQCSGPGCYQARQCTNGCCDGLNVCHGYATGDKLCTAGRKCDDGNPCHSGGTVSTSGNPRTCTGFTNVSNGASCDPDSSACTADQCSSGACVHAASNAGVTCHTSGGACDTTTACTGTSTSCPSALKAAGTTCRAANGDCDVAETCTGSSASCPPDAVATSSTVCRASTSSCDPAETCPGVTGYTQAVTLTNPAGGAAQTDFQVLLQILGDNTAFWNHLDGGVNATGHDIHVQDASGNELSFWIEQLDTVSQRARIWVKVPSIGAPPSTATLTLGYGSTTRTAGSDIGATMVFGDEFIGTGSGTSISGLDGSKWTVDDAAGWAVTATGGGHLTSRNVGGRIHSATSVATGMVLETKWKITTGNDFAYVVVDGVKNAGNTKGDALVAGLDIDDGHQFNYWNNILWTDTFNWSGNYTTAFARSSIAVIATTANSNTSTLTVWADGSNSRTLAFSQAYNPSSAALTLGKPYDDISDGSGTFTADWDWALIRKYAATPPTLVASNNEAPDTASHACPADINTCGTQASVPTPTQLPAPPDVRGCYVGTWNGWVSVPCTPYDQLPASIQQKPYMGGGQVTIPGYLDGGETSFGPIPGITSSTGLKFGEVETTFVDVATDSMGNTETNVPPQSTFLQSCAGGTATPQQLSVQANTNNFPATTGDAALNGDTAWVQYAIQYQGVSSNFGNPGFNICIWNNDFTLGKKDLNFITNASAAPCLTNSDCETGRTCVDNGSGGQCLAPTYWADCLATTNYSVHIGSTGFNLAVQSRQLQPLDRATVAGSAFTDANDGQADLGLVAAMTWFDPSNNNNDYHGLYAIVTKDRYGLGASTHWTNVSGTVLGLGNCGIGTFPQGTMVYTAVEAGNCATQGTPPPPATVTWPGVCANTLNVSSSTPAPAESTLSLTDESNNLNIIGTPSALANGTDGNNYLQMHYLASVDGACVSTPRVYVKDHPQDHGSTPSNLGGEAFWESPDIIVASPTATVTPTTPAGDPTVIAGNNYNVYVRVHNDFACSSISGVRARVWWGDAALATPVWTDVITSGPDPSNPHWSAAKVLSATDSVAIIGPIPWTAPSNVNPHECLLVDIQADGEGAPVNTADAPGSYQVAQRNIEIGGACSWNLTNGSQPSQLGIKLTATDGNGQPYVLTAGDSATVTFADSSQDLFNAWNGNSHPGCSLNHDSNAGTTTVTMNVGVGQATVQGAPLSANATLSVSSTVIPTLFSGTRISLQIATFLTSSGGGIQGVPTNGASCMATAQNGIP